MKIKKGDTVTIIAGNDKGKTGLIKKVFIKKNKVLVEGVNIKTEHNKPSNKNPDGGISKHEAPIDVSNVALVEPKTGKIVKIGYKFENDKKIRINRKTGTPV